MVLSNLASNGNAYSVTIMYKIMERIIIKCMASEKVPSIFNVRFINNKAKAMSENIHMIVLCLKLLFHAWKYSFAMYEELPELCFKDTEYNAVREAPIVMIGIDVMIKSKFNIMTSATFPIKVKNPLSRLKMFFIIKSRPFF